MQPRVAIERAVRLSWFRNDRLRLPTGDENRQEREHKLPWLSCPRTELMVWPVKTGVLIEEDWKECNSGREVSFSHEVSFSLDFSFYFIEHPAYLDSSYSLPRGLSG